MTKSSGMGDQLLIGGYLLGASTNSLSRCNGGPTPLDMTDITQSAFERKAVGRDGGMTVVSYWNPSAGGSHDAYSPLPRTDVVGSYLHTQTIGGASANTVAKQIGYDPQRGQDGSLLLTVDMVSSGFGLQWAFQATAGVRTDAAATAAAAVSPLDQLTATPGAFGGVMWLHMTSLGSGNPTIKLQESSDNAGDAYTDVVGATSGVLSSAPYAARIELGAINVERYIKVVTTGTFTNAAFSVSFVRHRTAVVF